jgi:hypothetical protein
VIDLNSESALSLPDAARLVPAGHGAEKTHISTLLRWIIRGAKAPDGSVVRLEGIRMGSRWFTSRQALQRFAARLTPQLDGDQPRPPRSIVARNRASQRAARELEKVGI